MWKLTSDAPEPHPNIVISEGSPPKAGSVLLNIFSAATISDNPALPEQLSDSHRPKKPKKNSIHMQAQICKC